MRIRDDFVTKAVIVGLVFPILILVSAALARGLGIAAVFLVPVGASGQEFLYLLVTLVSLAGGIVASFLICRHLWPRKR